MKYAFAFVAMLPTSLWAACPTGADLTLGIVIGYPDGATETFTQIQPNVVSAIYAAPDGFVSESLLSQGVYLVQTQEIVDGMRDPGTRMTYTYPLSPGAMPTPRPGGSWSANVVTMEGGSLDQTQHDMRFEAETTLAIGACSYRMVPIEVTYDGDGELLHYLPELGIAPVGAWGVGADRDMTVYAKIQKAE